MFNKLKSMPILEIGLVVAWSSGFIGGTLASNTGSIFTVLFWRFLITSVILLPFSIKVLTKLTKRDLLQQCVIGGFAMFGYLATIIAAIDMGVSPGTAALIASLQPIVTAALAGIVLSEKVVLKQWIGLCLGFVGVAVTVVGGLNDSPLLAYALALLSMICIVIATFVAKAKPSKVSILPSLTIQCLITSALFMPLAYFNGGLVPEISLNFVYAVVWFILFSTLGAYGLYWQILSKSSATRVSSLIYLTPPVTTLWAWVMFGEAITVPAILGLAISAVGVYLTLMKTKNTKIIAAQPGSLTK
ncbi:MAG: DMT family transporter [Pseudoalteromonas sp.]|uniref:DMT family transporter n=1 Tax=Pseudoalteromonas prydzensis TaxID=182141 RepID=A0ABR9FQ15_9GAMM|nr:DMT family transporter [Pseudoalteromonas prydzensis]MBE0458899.1 DMT family transporter [Pseudoalteromonas prydzensis]